MTIRDSVLNNKKKYHDNHARFRDIFGDNLANYWDLTGFDVIKFDDLIQPGENQSTDDAIREKYGQEAVDFAHSLI